MKRAERSNWARRLLRLLGGTSAMLFLALCFSGCSAIENRGMQDLTMSSQERADLKAAVEKDSFPTAQEAGLTSGVVNQ